jgi:hypothetical protein
VTLDH